MCLGWQLPALRTCMRSAGSRVLLKSPVQKFTPQSRLKDAERVYLIIPQNTLRAFYPLYPISVRASDLATSSFLSPHLTKLAVQGAKCLSSTHSLFTQLSNNHKSNPSIMQRLNTWEEGTYPPDWTLCRYKQTTQANWSRVQIQWFVSMTLKRRGSPPRTIKPGCP